MKPFDDSLVAPYVGIEIVPSATTPGVFAGVFRCCDVAYHVVLRCQGASSWQELAQHLRDLHRCQVTVRIPVCEGKPEEIVVFPYPESKET